VIRVARLADVTEFLVGEVDHSARTQFSRSENNDAGLRPAVKIRRIRADFHVPPNPVKFDRVQAGWRRVLFQFRQRGSAFDDQSAGIALPRVIAVAGTVDHSQHATALNLKFIGVEVKAQPVCHGKAIGKRRFRGGQ